MENATPRGPLLETMQYSNFGIQHRLLYNFQFLLSFPSSALCVNQPSKTTAPFPHMFNDNVNFEGYLNNEIRLQSQGKWYHIKWHWVGGCGFKSD